MDLQTSHARIASQLRAELERLDQLAALPADWDTYGSPPLSATALGTARQLLVAAVKLLPAHEGMRVRPRAILPIPGGGVQIDWGDSMHKLSVEVGPTGELAYLIVDKRGATRRSDEVEDAAWPEVLEQIGRVVDA